MDICKLIITLYVRCKKVCYVSNLLNQNITRLNTHIGDLFVGVRPDSRPRLQLDAADN